MNPIGKRPSSTHIADGPMFFLSDRDSQILHFIWRWKLASTATIHEEIGKPNTPYSTYKAMERLQRLQYVTCVVNHLDHHKTWQLTEKGFETIRPWLGTLKEEGYLSENQTHDRHIVAFQLGEWAGKKFPQVTFFTEQEMRRWPTDYYPEWVPKVGNHRADGYTQIQGHKRLWNIAYEVELWPKSVAIYESLIRYYRMYNSIDRVYWLIGSPVVFDQIVKAKTNARDVDDNYHLFVTRYDYERLGWDAPVRNSRSEILFTIRDDMRGLLGQTLGEFLANPGGLPTVPVHYSKAKVIGKPRPLTTL